MAGRATSNELLEAWAISKRSGFPGLCFDKRRELATRRDHFANADKMVQPKAALSAARGQ